MNHAGDLPYGPESPNDAGSLGSREELADVVCAHGTVGWDGDDDHCELGSVDNDGVTLIKVQLFAGRDTDDPIKPGVAQGHKIRARLNFLAGWRVPPKGTECMVLFPSGFSETPGIGIVVAATGKNTGADQFKERRVVLDYTGYDLVMKADRVCIQTTDDDATGKPGAFIAITPEDGVQIIDDKGNGFNIKDGKVMSFTTDGADPPVAQNLVELGPNGVRTMIKDGGYEIVDADGVTAGGNTFAAATGGVSLGAGASPATPVVVGPTGMSGVGSTTVRAQP